MVNTSFSAIKKEVFDASGGFNINWRLGEDAVYGASLIDSGYRLFLCHDIQVEHLKSPF